ncbi:FAD binding domain-containing protein [Rhodoplanes sp. TEM]|uniref:FAD binding domain-containing protein n=1 Tax=Rhodoplanes tepidamans TaxID=200616 RepID=A0ABT5JGW4_RHOTP|nr:MULTISPECIES: FAD binding domain-containing protein [Rhodoplanes]MDC7788752.1 FAD binding domain-containing protein [Rhodoplanes tepidamans]MDC7983437.1 FAD binding domain-containing protein [Rhodoplanes sp. TEM]MDQ0354573.1 carbon-monoxide dehydrogenase medium subunit [Rhodoplanes tepidamans]
MKAAAFDYVRPASVAEACALLAEDADSKVMAGGQSLGPMLNLRLARPARLIDITRIPELGRVEESADAVTLGAVVTHAAIEDRRVADPTHGFLSRVARGIAYRAVRSRGTIGGSLAHADPAADWVSSLTALGAEVLITRADGTQRRLPVEDFIQGALASALEPGEILDGVRIPRFSAEARFGFEKICRKTGEFAEAMGVAVHDPARGVCRIVAGAAGGRPVVIEASRGAGARLLERFADAAAVHDMLTEAGLAGDAYRMRLHVAAVRRAVEEIRR